jgi:hypothetical protein
MPTQKQKEDMRVEENLKSKSLYKVFLLSLKCIPFVLALGNVLNTIFSYFCIELVFLTYMSSIGIIPMLFMYLAAYVFRFCIYHRIFLDYTSLSTCITIYDYYVGIPIVDAGIMTLQLALFFIASVVALITHLKQKKHDT